MVVALGRPPRVPGAPVNVGVEFTSTYLAGGPINYARAGNPTWSAFESALGELEGGRALAFASGMGAISAVLAAVPAGGRIVSTDVTYNGTSDVLIAFEKAGGTVDRISPGDTEGFRAALPGADLLWLESPTNPLLDVVDCAAVLGFSRDAGVLSCVDNTFNTPLGAQPISWGADVVMHSVTKYLAGHSDVILGATITTPAEVSPRAAALHEHLLEYRRLGGAIPGPMEMFLALRGMRTLALRWERACANAADLAGRLQSHTGVSRVRYPGFGAMVSIEVNGGAEGAEAVSAACRLWTDATSLGGVESLLERRARIASEPKSVPENLLRLSVGIEHVDDLWADLDQALRASARS